MRWNNMGILLLILVALPSKADAPLKSAPANWGPGCNNALLEGEFALGKAPDLKVSDDRRSVIDTVVGELKHNHGGTLVTRRCPDPDIDTPEFVAHYLRAFAELPDGKDLKSYDYRFARLLARVAKQPGAVEDARLDWDVMRAYLAYENFTDGSSSYRSNEIQGSPLMKSLESARDFLCLFLDQNAQAILKDPPRLQWWLRHLSADLEAPGGRPFRRWFLLQLVAASDPDRFFMTVSWPFEPSASGSPSPWSPSASSSHLGSRRSPLTTANPSAGDCGSPSLPEQLHFESL